MYLKVMPAFSPFRTVGKRSVPNNFDLISRSFDENVLPRLKTLISISSPPSISLSWLSMAVDFLSSTHAEAETLISNLKLSDSSDESLALYMDLSVKLLDICNSISCEIQRLGQRRLVINFVIKLLEFSGEGGQIPAPEKLRKARDSLSDWENNSQGLPKKRSFQNLDLDVLIRDLAAALGSLPSSKISSAGKLVRRTIYAVGLTTLLIAGVLASALYGLPDVAKIQAPPEFLWANSFNDLQSAIFEEIKRRSTKGEERKGLLVEFDDVATRAVGVRDLVDAVVLGGSDEVKKFRLLSAVKELEMATSKFSNGLDRLSDGVNGMFKTVLSTRNGVLENFRIGKEKKKVK